MKSLRVRSLHTLTFAVSVIAICCATAEAHPHHHGHEHGNGLVDGLLHPLFGMDHLLAMIAVGLLSAQIGGRALWAIPCAFVGSMILGGVLGLTGMPLPGVEYGIALSILLLGLALAVNRKQPLAVPLTAAAIFGFFHGHAHGTEIPTLATPVIYAGGFVATTIALHVTGVLIGRMAISSIWGQRALRTSGAAITLAGMYFLIL